MRTGGQKGLWDTEAVSRRLRNQSARRRPVPELLEDQTMMDQEGLELPPEVDLVGMIDEPKELVKLGPGVDLQMPTPQRGDRAEPWERDEIQFPRLLAEIRASGLSLAIYADLRESMGLTNREIDSVLERAETEWERIKAQVAGKHRP